MNESQHRWRHRLSRHTLITDPADRFGQDGLDVQRRLRGAGQEQPRCSVDSPMGAGDGGHLVAGRDDGGHRGAAIHAVEQREGRRPPAEDRDAERFKQLGGGGDVQDRLRAGGHDNRRGAGDLRQVGRDVETLGEAAVHAAGPAGGQEPDASGPAGSQGAADRGGTERALHNAGGQVTRADLACGGARCGEPLQVLGAQPDSQRAVHDPDRGRDGPGAADPGLGVLGRREAASLREAVRDQRRFQRHDRFARGQRLGDLPGELRCDHHGIAPICATARAAASKPILTPPSR
jgi:hypothetical protein